MVLETYICTESNYRVKFSKTLFIFIFFFFWGGGEYCHSNGIESSLNMWSIKLKTNLKTKVYLTNVALLIRYLTGFENKQQKSQKQDNHKNE